MYALTVLQPWAQVIVDGFKNVENRSQPHSAAIGKRLAIHAGKKPVDMEAVRWCDLEAGVVLTRPRECVLGAILGTVLVSNVIPPDGAGWPNLAQFAPWWERGAWGLVLRDVVRFREPLPCRGFQGLWTAPKEVFALEAHGVKIVETWRR
jgi:hypothetical protein